MRLLRCFATLLALATLLLPCASDAAAGPTEEADSAASLLQAQLQRCSSNCAVPTRCSLVAGKAICQDSCYAGRCARGENCVQRQCGSATQQRPPCDAQVFCFAVPASVSSRTLPFDSASAGFSPLLQSSFATSSSSTSAFAVDAPPTSTPVRMWEPTAGQPSGTTPNLVASAATSSTTSKGLSADSNGYDQQPLLYGGTDNLAGCDDHQVCVLMDGEPDVISRGSCVNLCDPRRCHATQVCRMRAPVACASPPCRKVATCK